MVVLISLLSLTAAVCHGGWLDELGISWVTCGPASFPEFGTLRLCRNEFRLDLMIKAFEVCAGLNIQKKPLQLLGLDTILRHYSKNLLRRAIQLDCPLNALKARPRSNLHLDVFIRRHNNGSDIRICSRGKLPRPCDGLHVQSGNEDRNNGEDLVGSKVAAGAKRVAAAKRAEADVARAILLFFGKEPARIELGVAPEAGILVNNATWH